MIMTAGLFMLPGGAGVAQTIYNAPAQSGDSTPLNWKQLFQRDRQNSAVPTGKVPYAVSPGDQTGASDFARRQAALNQWRNQRDAVAQDQASQSLAYMAAQSETPFEKARGSSSQIGPISTPLDVVQPTGPMIYRGKDEDTVKKPQRIFNTID